MPVTVEEGSRPARPWDGWPTSYRVALVGSCAVLATCWAVSFDAIVVGALSVGIPWPLVLTCPFIVDGQMAIGTVVLIAIARRVKRRTRVYLGGLIALSVLVSATANAASPYTRTLVSAGDSLPEPWLYLVAVIPSLWIALLIHQLVILWRHSAPPAPPPDTATVGSNHAHDAPAPTGVVSGQSDGPSTRRNGGRSAAPGDGREAVVRALPAATRPDGSVNLSELARLTKRPRTTVSRLLTSLPAEVSE